VSPGSQSFTQSQVATTALAAMLGLSPGLKAAFTLAAGFERASGLSCFAAAFGC
jgi:hypothetical protein